MLLYGIVYNTPLQKVSPSGIPHCQLILEHRSKQEEAGFLRQVWCYMPVIISGQKNKRIIKQIKVGVKITVKGFVCSHHGYNSLSKIVLHAEQIELLRSGD